jgi:NAD dependent epimerase/dehydratase family enzyme
VRNEEFTNALAGALHRPAFFHVPAMALRLLGEFSNELLGSKRVLPGVASAQGFPFEFPELPAALKRLI